MVRPSTDPLQHRHSDLLARPTPTFETYFISSIRGIAQSALTMLQAGTIVAALPFTFIVLASGVRLALGLKEAPESKP